MFHRFQLLCSSGPSQSHDSSSAATCHTSLPPSPSALFWQSIQVQALPHSHAHIPLPPPLAAVVSCLGPTHVGWEYLLRLASDPSFALGSCGFPIPRKEGSNQHDRKENRPFSSVSTKETERGEKPRRGVDVPLVVGIGVGGMEAMEGSKATWKRRKVKRWEEEQEETKGREEEGRKEWDRMEFTCRNPCEPSGTNGGDGKVECFDRNELWCKMWKSARDVSELLGINESQAILMLKATCWDEEKLLDQYLLRAEQFCEKAGLPPPTGQTEEYLCSIAKRMFTCVICANAGELLVSSLSCQHFYCNDCWQTYLHMKVNEGETAVSCPHFSCSRRCTPKFIQQLCTKETFQKYEHFLLNAYVEETSWLVWCPSPGCGLVVHPKTSQQFAQCAKGHAFCTCCKEEFHAPASCDVVKEWNQKCQDDTETAHWLVANTKNCPNCSCTIEKDGGCNHMKCSKCKHEFCWVCMGDWVLHTDNYTCNRYDPGQAKTDNYKVKNAKGILNRYLFYYHRFMNHWQSLKLDKKTRARAELKMSQYAELRNGSLWSDFSFIGEAVEKLLQCRQTLKWTYVFAWQMEEDNPGRALFCYLQENLEIKTELLSGLLERSISDMMQESVRGRIIDLAQVTYQARSKLLDGISCG